MGEQISTPHRDFYNVRKVDTHVHHSAAMNGKHLLRFIKKKLKSHGTDFVMTVSGERKTLAQIFESLGLGWMDLSLDKLNVVADQNCFHRFDRFNLKYNPLNQPMLRTIFLKTDNEIQGRYLAEITEQLFDDLDESKYQLTEWRLSIYGRARSEWDNLAKWVMNNKLVREHNMWMIQIPRLFNVYKAAGQLQNFQDMLDNIFLPIFDATLDPESHPELSQFLDHVSGFDSVDDETKSSGRNFSSKACDPANWTHTENPSYRYYNYYLQTNLRVLNRVRARAGKSQFSYRPHSGEAGEIHHLDTSFLLADSISHGLNLRKSMPLQYLFYLASIGIAMSPCSNNHLFVSYHKHPFHEFFTRGLNLSLSTDDPLMFHQTKEPLMEEYSLAKQFFRLSSADMCELARNSVLMSGFPASVQASWLGSADRRVNIISRSNVPDARIRFRTRCLEDELGLVHSDSENLMEAFREAIPRLSDTAPLAFVRQPSPAIKAGKRSTGVSPTLRKSLTPMMTCVRPELVEDLVVEMPLIELPESTLPADEPKKKRRTECVGDKHDKGLNAETDI